MPKRKLVFSENDVKDILKRWFNKVTGSWSYAPVQNGMGEGGIPDRVGCVPITITENMVGKTFGLFVAIEAKKPGRRGEENAGATGLQVERLRSILAAGGIAGLVDCEDDIRQVFEHIGRDNEGAARLLERRIKSNG